jgi:metal-sulfur cluster biosynthetic enzyme
VLNSLREVVDPERGVSIVDLRLVKSLRIEPGEAELTVTFRPQCSSSRVMAEGAFERLRRALPDTDIYVLHTA